jgi:hypothetical protein
MRGQRDKITFFPQGAIAFFVALAAAILFFSCGLPTPDYLYPTSGFSQEGANIVVLSHNSDNVHDDNGFNGYEIYYRIFDDYDNAYKSWEYLSKNLTSDIKTIADSERYYPLLKKTSDGSAFDYETLIRYTECEADANTKFSLHIETTKTWTISYYSSPSDALSYVVRNLGEGVDISKAEFFKKSNYEVGDQDYDGTVNGPSTIYIVYFAVAYGTSPTSLSDIYSNPNDDNGAGDIIGPSYSYSPGS